jgi:hypothetical protein
MKEIPLTQGKLALIDDEDYDEISKTKWTYLTAGTGYAIRYKHEHGKTLAILMHRQIMNPDSEMEIDHIDKNTLNNCKSNLRTVTHAENMQNRKVHRTCKSGIRGVYFEKDRNLWVAQIGSGKSKHTKRFRKIEDAEIYINNKRMQLMPYSI